jgi:hypothetical protein
VDSEKAALDGLPRCRASDISMPAGVHGVHVGYTQFAYEYFIMCMYVLTYHYFIGKYEHSKQSFSSW